MNIIITSPKHLGKSTLIAKLISVLPGKVSGFITEFIDRDMADRALILRSIDGKQSQKAVVWEKGVYTIDHAVFDSFAPSLIDPLGDFVVIDELGKFEKDCTSLCEAVKTAFDSPCHVIASIRLDAAGWMQELKNRDDILLINLDENNRDALPVLIAEKLDLK